MAKNKKILFFSNIIAPYNIEYFNGLSLLLGDSLQFYFDAQTESNRSWNLNKETLNFNYTIQKSWKIEKQSAVNHNSKLNRTIYFPFYVFRKVLSIKPSVVISIEFGLRSLFALIAGRLTGAKVLIVSDVTKESESSVNGIKKVFRKFISKFSDGAIARSYKAKDYLMELGFTDSKITVAPYAVKANGLDHPTPAQHKNVFTLLFVGHFQHLKGVDLLFTAIRSLPDSYKERLNLKMAGGDHTQLADYTQQIDRSMVEAIGFLSQEELAHWYQRADAFVLPTRQDTWGLVINEAVQNHCPVLISKYAGAADELIKHHQTGLVFDPLNTTDFVKTLQFAIDHPAQLQQYAKNATILLNEYNYEVASTRTADMIRELLKSDKNEITNA